MYTIFPHIKRIQLQSITKTFMKANHVILLFLRVDCQGKPRFPLNPLLRLIIILQ